MATEDAYIMQKVSYTHALKRDNNIPKTIYTQQKKLRKSQKTMQYKTPKQTIIQLLFICLDTCHRLRKTFTLVC